MSLRTLILLSPFVIAVLIGRSASRPEAPAEDPTGPIPDFSMARYEGERRPLLLFAPSDDDPYYNDTIRLLARNMPALEEHELVILELFEDGTSRAEGREIGGAPARAIREAFGIEPGAVSIVLARKDGSEIRRWQEELPPLQHVFDAIDD